MSLPWEAEKDEQWLDPWPAEPGWPEEAYLGAEYGLFKRDAGQ
jgi:hypothetical protein